MKSFQKACCMLLLNWMAFGIESAMVSDVTARQRYPWNGKVDIDYTVTGSNTTSMALTVMLTDHETGRGYSLTGDGRHQLTWGRTNSVVSNVAVTVLLVPYSTPIVTKKLYCVVDLSAGPDAAQWPVSYLSSIPSNGWTDEYKTTKLVLRRIEAGTFIMGRDQSDIGNRVIFTRPFYVGVFEVTQRQWELVMGSWPNTSMSSSSYGRGDTYPAYYVSFDDVRGSSSRVKGSTVEEVAASSFLGKLCARTGLNFDLPTQAQWEYTYRAGTMTTYYWGDSMDGAYTWYWGNASWQTHPVGTKLPNAWGLYDMSGNVWEWCLDCSGDLDPIGCTGDVSLHGGSWGDGEEFCNSTTCLGRNPSHRSNEFGFRIVRILSD